MIEEARVPSAQSLSLLNGFPCFGELTLLVKTSCKRIEGINVFAHVAFLDHDLQRFIKFRGVVSPEEGQLSRVSSAGGAGALDKLDQIVLSLRVIGSSEPVVEVAQGDGVVG